MTPRLSGQTSIFGVVFFVSKSLLGIEGQKKLEKFAIFTRKPRSHARILIYRTWPIDYFLQAPLFTENIFTDYYPSMAKNGRERTRRTWVQGLDRSR